MHVVQQKEAYHILSHILSYSLVQCIELVLWAVFFSDFLNTSVIKVDAKVHVFF